MNDSDLRARLDALVVALAPTALPHLSVDSLPADPSGADAQRIATTQIDELMRRISALTGILGTADGRGWDEVDQLAAQLLIADLSAVTSTTRAVNNLAASRLQAKLPPSPFPFPPSPFPLPPSPFNESSRAGGR